MRKLCWFTIAACILFSLAACGEAANSKAAAGAKTVNEVLQEQTSDDQTTATDTSAPDWQTYDQPKQSEASAQKENTGGHALSSPGIDVDLTALSSTMVYSEVYNMLVTPKDYVNKKIKMSGIFVPYTNSDESKYYPACVIQDATACCSQGMEFLLSDAEYPEDYPEMGTEITVIGTFETYKEGGTLYCHLVEAALE